MPAQHTTMRLHASVRILLWLMFAVSIGAWGASQLLLCSVGLLPLLKRHGAAAFFRLLRRSRWLLLSLFCVYALATPGVPLWSGLPVLSQAGLLSGFLQAWRLVLMFAGVGLLQAVSSADDLLYGLYVLLSRLKRFGVDAERIAIRIALTLQYVGQEKAIRPRNWQEQLRLALGPAGRDACSVMLCPQPFTWRDWAALAAMTVLLAVTFLSGFMAWPLFPR